MKKCNSLHQSGADGVIDRYPDVFNLLSHVDDLEPEDLFQVSTYKLARFYKFDNF